MVRIGATAWTQESTLQRQPQRQTPTNKNDRAFARFFIGQRICSSLIEQYRLDVCKGYFSSRKSALDLCRGAPISFQYHPPSTGNKKIDAIP
jgi:hypothetical protein